MADVTQLTVPVKNGSTVTMTTLDIKDAGIWDLVPSSASASNPLLVSADVSGKFEVQGTVHKYDVVGCSTTSFPNIGNWKSLPLEGNGTLFTSIKEVSSGNIKLFGISDMNLAKGSIVVFTPPSTPVSTSTVTIQFVTDTGSSITSAITVGSHLKAILARNYYGVYSKIAIMLKEGSSSGSLEYEILCAYNSDSVATFNGRTGAVTPASGDYSIDMIAPTSGATEGQVPVLVNVGTTQEPDLQFQLQSAPSAGVSSFNSRTGAVSPASGDYSLGQITATGTAGQVPVLDGNGSMAAETLVPIYYCTCSTASSTAAKVISASVSGRSFRLQDGCLIAVRFSYTNQATSGVTLNVESSGDISIYDPFSDATSGVYGIAGSISIYTLQAASTGVSAYWKFIACIPAREYEDSLKGFKYLDAAKHTSTRTASGVTYWKWLVTSSRLVSGGLMTFVLDADCPAGVSFEFDATPKDGRTFPVKFKGSAVGATDLLSGDVVTMSFVDVDSSSRHLEIINIYRPGSSPTPSTSGHTIENASGTAMTDRANLQFKGLSVTDDSTNDRTVVELSISGTASAGAFLTSDGSGGYQWTTIPQAEGSSF